MSAHVLIHCDAQVSAYGMCPHRTYVQADTVEQARTAVREQGWLTTREGRDRCPTCAGRRP